VVDRFDGVKVHSGRDVVVGGGGWVEEVGCGVVRVASKIWVISMGLFQASSR